MEKSRKKTALVTGAGTGLGRAIAITLAKEGFRVALTGRRENKLREVESEIGKENTIVLTADVLNESSVLNLKDQLLKETGGNLDLLVNNVGGVAAMGRIDEMNLEQWHQVMDKNLTSAFITTQAFLPALRKSKTGTIISITSMVTHKYFEGLGAYAVSKVALEAFMKIIEEEESEIKIHLFDPGSVTSEANPQGGKDPMEIMDEIVALVK